MGLWLNTHGALLPWGTLAANLIGGYLIGLCLALFQALPQLDSAEVVGLLQQQRLSQALGLCALHVAGSLCMTWAGLHSLPWLWAGARQGV
ncbi:MAG: hypothetical protein DI574_00260 [Acidovorax sp.]|nr:MAG: hypothetical protein DI574_00260 [Acidovorax sp.]